MTGAPKIRAMKMLNTSVRWWNWDIVRQIGRGTSPRTIQWDNWVFHCWKWERRGTQYRHSDARLHTRSGPDPPRLLYFETTRRAGFLQTSVGAGGGIVALSDPVAEFDEMLLKAATVIGTYPPVETGEWAAEGGWCPRNRG